jgi:L-threo-3-deoxy-hexylosonate aldolase
LPILLYSFPAVVAGIEMDSDLLISISKHPNVVGTKFTCGDTGKLGRVARAMNAITPQSAEGQTGYVVLGGLADFELPAFVAGASGVIAGGANVTPKACAAVFSLYKEDRLRESIEAQRILSTGDWAHTKRGVAGTKAALEKYFGYGGDPRRPLKPLDDVSTSQLLDEMEELIRWERSI